MRDATDDPATGLGVRLDRLVVRRGRATVLHEVSLELSRGTNVLLGPNGAGKTTLLDTVVGLLRPSSGSVRLTPDDRREIGFVPQVVGLPAGVGVADVVRYAAWLQRVPRAAAAERVEAALDAVRLGDRRTDRVNRLSGGMRRRVQLACAIVHEPELLVLDEPTVGLDPAEQEAFCALVTEQGRRRTVLLSTHQLDEAARVADRIMILVAGTVQVDEPAAALVGGQEDARALRTAYLSAVGGA